MQDKAQVVLLKESLLINLIGLVRLRVPTTYASSRDTPGKVDELM